jgi:hypothetical protein
VRKEPNLFQKITVVFFLVLGTAILALLIYYGTVDINSKSPASFAEYNIDALKAVPPELIKYDEQKQISVKAEKLYALTVNSKDEIIVSADNKIFIYSPQGEELRNFPLEEAALSLSSRGQRLIYAGLADHVEIYTTEGNREEVWAGLGQNALITSLAVGGDNVFVADAGNKLIMHYDLKGRLIGYIGGEAAPEEASRLVIPSPYFDLAAGKDNALWVVNPGRHKLLHFTFDGKLLGSWGVATAAIHGFSGCCNPTHIALTEQGFLVTSEKGLVRVKVYNLKGELEAVVAAPDKFTDDTVGLDLASNRAGDILVLDPQKKQVRIFKKR